MDPRLEEELMKKYYPEMFKARTEGDRELEDARSMEKWTNAAPGIGQMIGSITAPKRNSLPYVAGWGESMAQASPAQIRPTEIDLSDIKNAGNERVKSAGANRDRSMKEGLALDQLAQKARDTEEETNPESPRAQAARDMMRAALPDLVSKIPNYDSLSLNDLKTTFPAVYKAYIDREELGARKRIEGRKEEKEDKKISHDRYKRSVDIRKELSQNPVFKNSREIEGKLAQVDELVKNSDGVADEAILVMYQKALDPGSVVREGEFARTAEGQALLSRVDTLMSKYTKGTRMSPELRSNVLGTMKALRDGNRIYLQKVLAPYEREIRDYQLDRGIILGDDEEESGGPSVERAPRGASTNSNPNTSTNSNPTTSTKSPKGGKFDGRALP